MRIHVGIVGLLLVCLTVEGDTNPMINCAACLHVAEQQWASWDCDISCKPVVGYDGALNISALAEKVTQLETRIAVLENRPAYSFSVRLSATYSPVNDDPVAFDTVNHNIGGGYDKTTGVFTVPVTGTYFFSVYANSDDNWGEVYIKRNTDILCHIQVLSSASYNSACSAVANATQGDSVRVTGDNAQTTAFKASVCGFTGHIINQN